MPICFLHVGTPKTGSSAIQYAFAASAAHLEKQGLLYPDDGNNFHRALAGLPTAGNAVRINRYLREGMVRDALGALRPYVSHNLVLSNESLSSNETLPQFVDGLKELGYATHCLIFFRPQVEMIPSSYCQRAKLNDRLFGMTVDAFALQQIKPCRFAKMWDWYARAQKLESAFDRLTVHWYPAVRSKGPTGIVSAAFAWLGLLAPAIDMPSVVNPTPSLEALEVIRSAFAQGRGGKRFADEFLARIHGAGLSGTPVQLGLETATAVHAAALGSNRALLERYAPYANLAPPTVTPRASIDEALVAQMSEIAWKRERSNFSKNAR